MSSLPFQATKIFRIFRIFKILRLSRVYGLRTIVRELRDNRAGSALLLTIFLVIVVLEFGGSLIVAVEANSPDSNIKTAGDGVWWAFVTITTVGYGDRFPVTESGRLVGMLTMSLGVGLFGVLTGFLANAFIPEKKEKPTGEPVGGDGEDQIGEIRKLIEQQERVTKSLKSKIAQIELSASSEGSSNS